MILSLIIVTIVLRKLNHVYPNINSSLQLTSYLLMTFATLKLLDMVITAWQLVLDYDEMVRIPFLSDYIRETNQNAVKIRYTLLAIMVIKLVCLDPFGIGRNFS